MWVRVAVIVVLIATNVFIFSRAADQTLAVSFLDVGQGDAIFVESPSGVQVLIDGGVDRSVLRGLGTHMSFFDRNIDAVVATHPDADHIGGLVDVLERYEVGVFIESGVENDTGPTRALEAAVQNAAPPRVIARRGMRLILGGGAYADILYPDRDVSKMETNAGSIVMRVVYGEHEFLLTGDAPKAIEGILVSHYGESLKSDVLKAGHHGSKTSSGEIFVKTVDPQYAVFSRGCDNRYGHPAPEVVATFQKFNIPTLDTCEEGAITFHSNGHTLSIK